MAHFILVYARVAPKEGAPSEPLLLNADHIYQISSFGEGRGSLIRLTVPARDRSPDPVCHQEWETEIHQRTDTREHFQRAIEAREELPQIAAMLGVKLDTANWKFMEDRKPLEKEGDVDGYEVQESDPPQEVLADPQG